MNSLDYQRLVWDWPDDSIAAFLEGAVDLNAPDPSGDYLLTVACQRLHVSLVKRLLSTGADPNVQNADGDTPALCAVNCVSHDPDGAREIVSALAASGANLEVRGYMDKTPFLKACCRNDLAMIQLLVSLGADYRATVEDGGIINGAAFADIFNAPKDVKDFLAGLQ